MRRRPVGRRIVRTAAVGGAAYLAGSHVATKSAEQQQHEAEQNAQIADLQQQQQMAAAPQPQPAPYAAPQYDQQYAPPQYAQPQYAQPQYAQPPASAAPAAPAEPPAAPARDPIEALKQLGELHAAGVVTDAEFEAKKAELLQQI